MTLASQYKTKTHYTIEFIGFSKHLLILSFLLCPLTPYLRMYKGIFKFLPPLHPSQLKSGQIPLIYNIQDS